MIEYLLMILPWWYWVVVFAYTVYTIRYVFIDAKGKQDHFLIRLGGLLSSIMVAVVFMDMITQYDISFRNEFPIIDKISLISTITVISLVLVGGYLQADPILRKVVRIVYSFIILCCICLFIWAKLT